MKSTRTKLIAAIGTLLGASLLMSGPVPAQADQGKWWQPKESRRGDRVERRVESRYDRGHNRGWNRQYRQWRGNRVYRDVIVIRDNPRGPRYRAWRSYCEPEFIYRRRIVRIRPVRYYVSASVVIGGVHVHGRFHDNDHYYYGCNFCDARYDNYGGYRAHVYECDDRPHGYQIVTNDWNDRELRDSNWWDDRNWEQDRDYDQDHDYDRDHDYDDGRDRDSRY